MRACARAEKRAKVLLFFDMTKYFLKKMHFFFIFLHFSSFCQVCLSKNMECYGALVLLSYRPRIAIVLPSITYAVKHCKCRSYKKCAKTCVCAIFAVP